MAAATMAGCNYLDIVPDNTVELSNLFETKEKAYNALADCYSYMPDIEGVHQSMALAGDEWIGRLDAGVAGVRSYTRGSKLMRDWNNSTDPILGFWSGAGGAKDLYEGIRICNIFLNGLGDIPNMQEEERIDWMSQVKVLKAYYHFYLLRLYGPIIIADKNYEPYDDIDLIRQERKPAAKSAVRRPAAAKKGSRLLADKAKARAASRRKKAITDWVLSSGTIHWKPSQL